MTSSKRLFNANKYRQYPKLVLILKMITMTAVLLQISHSPLTTNSMEALLPLERMSYPYLISCNLL